jgi:hypothetical protein
MWCIPQVDGEYVARMEDVLDLYAEAPDPKRPGVCFDESPVQLIGEARQPIPGPSRPLERYDYEYCRHGTVNLFIFLDVHRPWRKVKVTERRAPELRQMHALSCRCPLSRCGNNPCGSGQFFDPLRRRAVSGVPARRSQADLATPDPQAGSTWSRSRLASCGGNAWTAGSTTPSGYDAKSPLGNEAEMPPRSRIKWMFTTDKARANRAYPETSKES